MASIFINYRRADNAAGYSRSIAQRLREEFGHEEVFRDIKSIPPGKKFADLIGRQLDDCRVMLVLIGTQWVSVTDPDGKRRFDNPQDWVRREVAAALARDILVIPVLVCGAALPTRDELPPDLQPLLERNAFAMSDDDFEHDLEQLADALRDELKLPRRVLTGGAPHVLADRIADALGNFPGPTEDTPPTLLQRLWSQFAGLLKLALFIAIAVWIGYTQNDEFAASVDRFFARSAEMLQRLLN